MGKKRRDLRLFFCKVLAPLPICFLFSACMDGFRPSTQTLSSLSEVNDQTDGAGPSSTGSGGDSAPANPFVCSTPQGSPITPLRRLTKEEYTNSLLALVGSNLFAQLLPDVNTLANDALVKSISDFSALIQDTQMAAYQAIAEKAYQLMVANPSIVAQLVGNCITDATTTVNCRDSAITKLGKLAFRRPLTVEEIALYRTQLFPLGTSGVEGIGYVVYHMLQSPAYLLKVEVGDSGDTSSGDTFQLTQYEIASRLAYMLWAAPPDAELYEAADAGLLTDPANLKKQVDRMLANPLTKNRMSAFFSYWLKPSRYAASSYSSEFLKGANVQSMNEEYSREMMAFIDYIVWQKNGTYADLLTSNVSFAGTAEVAEAYGHAPVVSGGGPATMTGRRQGLLMRGPVIVTEGNETHPILRGVKFNNRFLCRQFGLPSGVMTSDPKFFSDEARMKMSTRERTAGITSNTSCMACHSQINPFAFAFENFDGLGRPRSVENAFSTTGTLLTTHPIDTKVDGIVVDPGTKIHAEDGFDVIQQIVDSAQGPACFATQMTRFYRIQLESPEDSCLLSSMYQNLRGKDYSGTSIVKSFTQLLTDPTITRRRFQ